MQTQYLIKIFIFLSIICAIVILLGIGLGLLYSSLPEHHPQKNQQNCEKAGGLWTDDQICLLSYKKAGEDCTDGGQCVSGICFPPILTDEQKFDLAKGSLNNIAGTCYPENQATGCIEQVVKGTITKESMCLDY